MVEERKLIGKKLKRLHPAINGWSMVVKCSGTVSASLAAKPCVATAGGRQFG
jgi:hypothetical protein